MALAFTATLMRAQPPPDYTVPGVVSVNELHLTATDLAWTGCQAQFRYVVEWSLHESRKVAVTVAPNQTATAMLVEQVPQP